MKDNYLKRKGFTLAEVLITLGIIGIVAALTIPTLMTSYQNTQHVTALKKAYSETNQALKQMATDNGCTDNLKCTGLFAAGTNHQTLGNEFIKYFKISKNCGVSTDKGCWATKTNHNYEGPITTWLEIDGWGSYKFITVDSMSFSFENGGDNCVRNWSVSGTGNASQMCGQVYIDVNGPQKGPNAFGRDTFLFLITNGKGALLYPSGGKDENMGIYANHWWNDGDANNCSPAGSKSGEFCTGRIMEKGWEMDY